MGHQKKSVSEILTDKPASINIITDNSFNREIFLKTRDYETDISSQNNNIMQLTHESSTTGFKISFIEEIKGVIDTVSFDSNITTIKYNSKDPFKTDNFDTNINRLNFTISKNIASKVLLNNIVIKFKEAPIYYIMDKDYKAIDSSTLETNEQFITNNLKKDTMFKNTDNNKKMLKKFIEKVNSFGSIQKSNISKDDLNDKIESKYV